MRYLVEQGADMNKGSKKSMSTPIIITITAAPGTTLNTRDILNPRISPLQIAQTCGHAEIVAYLRAAGCQ
jgi:hypothetical protein